MADNRPASFSISNLSISPEEISPGEAITVSVLTTNNGDLFGSYNVVLTLNGEPVADKQVNLAGGQSEQVTFTTDIEEAGLYTVAIDDKSGKFEVKMPEPAESVIEPVAPISEETAPAEPPPEQPSEPVVEETMPPSPTPTTTPTPQPTGEQPVSDVYWWLIGGIIAAVIVIAELVWLKLRGRRSNTIKK